MLGNTQDGLETLLDKCCREGTVIVALDALSLKAKQGWDTAKFKVHISIGDLSWIHKEFDMTVKVYTRHSN